MEQAVQETGDSRHVAIYLLIYIEHFALLKIDSLSIYNLDFNSYFELAFIRCEISSIYFSSFYINIDVGNKKRVDVYDLPPVWY